VFSPKSEDFLEVKQEDLISGDKVIRSHFMDWLPECGSPLYILRLLPSTTDFFGTNTGIQVIKLNPSLTPLRVISSPNALSALARILSLIRMSSVKIHVP